jgi:branched-chain amino acid transport system permease protein
MTPSTLWLESMKNGVVNGALIALLAISFSWVYRTTRVFYIALAVQVLLGAYTAVYISQVVQSYFFSVFVGICTSALMSIPIMRLHTILQRREASNSLRLIASIGLYFIAVGICALCFGPDIKRGVISSGLSFQMGSFFLSTMDIRYLASILIVAFILTLVLKTSAGKGITAVGSNRRLYAVLGYNEQHVLMLVHFIAGAIAGLCGAFEGLRNGVEPYGYLPLVISASVAALLGGSSILLGPIVFGLLLGCLKSAAIQVFSDAWIDTTIFGMLLLAICFWPRLVLAPALEEERP